MTPPSSPFRPSASVVPRDALNLASGVSYFAIRAVCAVIQLRIVTQFIGPEYAGLNAVLNQVIYYVMLAELGLSTAAISMLYEPIKQGNLQQTAGLLSALRSDIRRLLLVATPLSLPLIYVYSRSLHAQIPWSIAFTSMVLVATSTLTTLLTVHCQAFLNASEKIFKTNAILGGGVLLKTAIGLGVAVRLHTYVAVPATMAILTIAEVVLLHRVFHAMFPAFRAFHLTVHTRKLREQAKYVLFHKFGGLIYYQSDFIILSLAASLVAVKTYAQYQYLAAGMIGLFNAAFSSVTSSIAARQIVSSPGERRHQYRYACLVAYFSAFCLAGAFCYSAVSFAAALFGETESLGWQTLILFSVLLFLNLIKTVDDVFITARGAFRPGFYLPLMEAGGYILQGVVLARLFGSEGILLAGITTNLVFSVVAKSIVVARNVVHSPAPAFLARKLQSLAVAAVLALPIILVLAYIESLSLNPSAKFILINLASLSYVVPITLVIIRRGSTASSEILPNPAPEEVAQ